MAFEIFGYSAVFVGVISVISVAGIFVAIGFIKKFTSGSSKEKFEPTDIEDMIKPDLYKLTRRWGTNTSLTMRYRYDEKGTVVKYLDYRSKINDSDSKDEEKKKQTVDVDSDQLEKDYEDGNISERIYKVIKKFDEEPVYILITRDSGFMGKLNFKFNSIFSGEEVPHDMVIVPERLVRDDVDYLTIKNNAEFQRFAGMDVAKESSVFNFIESIGFKNLYTQALQDQQNYHKQVNFYASQFSQELQKLEREAEIESKRFAGRNADLVNED